MSNIALEGINVLEYANEVSGPYCGKLLADLGADVIKVEPPEGDSSRLAGPFPDNKPHPEKSALFLYLNTNKKSVVLDINSNNGLDKFIKLIEKADILIDNHHPGHLERLGLGWEKLKELNPRIIYTSITPYGKTGRRSGVKGDELTILHAGGLANILPMRSTNIDRPPVKPGGNQAGYHGGIVAALCSLAALISQRKTGKGRFIDISLQDVVLSLIFPMAAGNKYQQSTWSRVPDRPPATGRMQTSDGYVVLGAADDHHFRKYRELMGKPKWVESDEWDNMYYRVNHMMDIAPMMEEWMRQQKSEDIFHKAAKTGIPIGPMYNAKEVMEDEQYAARGFFIEVTHPKAGEHKYAGWPYKMSGSPPRITRPAPLLGQHNNEVFNSISSPFEGDEIKTPSLLAGELSKSPSFLAEETIKSPSPLAGEGRGEGAAFTPRTVPHEDNILPLKGVRVLDLSWVLAGPYATRLLAELGAEVIKVEGHKRVELLRRSFIWPLPEPVPIELSPNQGMLFNYANMNKKSVSIDLNKPEGCEIVKKLAALSDVVIDNMRPDALTKLGLGYEDLCRIKKDIVVLKSSSRGLFGPQSEYLGFAIIHHSLGGGAYITGYPDDHPSHAGPMDADAMNAMTAAYAILSALYFRNRTGKGQLIDLSQTEAVSSLIGEVLLGYLLTAKIPERMGNAHPRYAPHNLYRCWGVDRWLALEIHSDEEFKILAKIINMPDLAFDSRFSDMASRKKNEKELDSILGNWTMQRDRDWMVEEFCRAGLAAAPSRDARDIYADRHLRDRNTIIKLFHPEMGEIEFMGPPWKMSNCSIEPVHAPILGQHNKYVLNELLGLSEDEISDLRKKEIIL